MNLCDIPLIKPKFSYPSTIFKAISMKQVHFQQNRSMASKIKVKYLGRRKKGKRNYPECGRAWLHQWAEERCQGLWTHLCRPQTASAEKIFLSSFCISSSQYPFSLFQRLPSSSPPPHSQLQPFLRIPTKYYNTHPCSTYTTSILVICIRNDGDQIPKKHPCST